MGVFQSKGVSFVPDRDIPSLKGKVILVTGGNAGLGKETVLQLSKHDPKEIWMASRSLERAKAAIADIRSKTNTNVPIKPLQLDLQSFESVELAAKSFAEQSSRLDLLFLNAGIMSFPPGTTKDGYEIQFGTNHMGHALLTKLLLPTLLKTAQEPGSDVRVVVLSSYAHNFTSKGLVFNTLKNSGSQLSDVQRYGQSKLANILWGQELARHYPQLRVPIVHPGTVQTDLGSTMAANSWLMNLGWTLTSKFWSVDVSTGTLNQLWAGVSKDAFSGEYYEPVGLSDRGSKFTKDRALAKQLWDWTDAELNAYVGKP